MGPLAVHAVLAPRRRAARAGTRSGLRTAASPLIPKVSGTQLRLTPAGGLQIRDPAPRLHLGSTAMELLWEYAVPHADRLDQTDLEVATVEHSADEIERTSLVLISCHRRQTAGRASPARRWSAVGPVDDRQHAAGRCPRTTPRRASHIRPLPPALGPRLGRPGSATPYRRGADLHGRLAADASSACVDRY